MTTEPTTERPGRTSEFIHGAGFLGRGLKLWVTSPGLMFLGALPAFIVGVLYVGALVLLVINLDALAALLTPFADAWTQTARIATRVAAGLAVVAVAVFAGVATFAAVTLAVGDPFYERIWRRVETRLGDAPLEDDRGFWRSVARAVADGIRLLLIAVPVGLLVFACGLVPIVGVVLAPLVGAFVGGWLLCLELTGYAFDARGLRLRDRRRMLGDRRARSVGFGAATYLAFLVPLGAVVVTPAAVAGATLLAREALDAHRIPIGAIEPPAPDRGGRL